MKLTINMNDYEIRSALLAHLRANYGAKDADPEKLSLFVDPQAADKLHLNLHYEEHR